MNMTATQSPACRCCPRSPVGKPTPANTWRACWGYIATPLAAGWPSTLQAALVATYIPVGKPVSLAPAVRASLEQALHRAEGFTSYEALRR
jgi:hypothetical protein